MVEDTKMKILPLFILVLGLHVSQAKLQVYNPQMEGWHFFLANNPPRHLDDCANYFFACTDWEQPGWPGNKKTCERLWEYCEKFFNASLGETKPWLLLRENYTTFIPTTPVTVKCEEGWIPNADTGYCYKVSEYKTNWNSARKICENENAEITSILTSKENAFIKDLMRRSNEKVGFWLGGNDKNLEGSWEWIDGTPVEFTDWQRGQPNNLNNEQDCMFLWLSDYKWHDEACTDWKNLPTICKKRGEHIESELSEKCDDGWNEYAATGSCYKVLRNASEWSVAKASCQAEGAELSSIESSQEWNFVKDFLTQTGYSADKVWLGGTDDNVEDTWKWTDGSQASFLDWHQENPQQPNHDGDCLQAGGNPPTMFDADCGGSFFALCKKQG